MHFRSFSLSVSVIVVGFLRYTVTLVVVQTSLFCSLQSIVRCSCVGVEETVFVSAPIWPRFFRFRFCFCFCFCSYFCFCFRFVADSPGSFTSRAPVMHFRSFSLSVSVIVVGFLRYTVTLVVVQTSLFCSLQSIVRCSCVGVEETVLVSAPSFSFYFNFKIGCAVSYFTAFSDDVLFPLFASLSKPFPQNSISSLAVLQRFWSISFVQTVRELLR